MFSRESRGPPGLSLCIRSPLFSPAEAWCGSAGDVRSAQQKCSPLASATHTQRTAGGRGEVSKQGLHPVGPPGPRHGFPHLDCHVCDSKNLPPLATHRTESSTNLPTWVLTTETSVNMKAPPPRPFWGSQFFLSLSRPRLLHGEPFHAPTGQRLRRSCWRSSAWPQALVPEPWGGIRLMLSPVPVRSFFISDLLGFCSGWWSLLYITSDLHIPFSSYTTSLNSKASNSLMEEGNLPPKNCASHRGPSRRHPGSRIHV